MADIAIFRINYKSDFILTLQSDAGWMIPFCIKFWTGAPSQAYYAYYDGMNYTHCALVEGEPTKLLVQFDDHHLPIGNLKFQIGYHFTVDDFPTSVEDEVLNQASVIIEVDDAPAQVMLDLNGETAPEIEFSLPAYTNEQQRITNEEQRIAAESIRIVNEESRIAAETTRQQNEAQRISNEESRVAKFARLNQESETATADANAAATLANEKAALAADKAALAQAAATLANDKAQLAADKAALAQAAATLANDKADLAQQKAAYAQAQGDYAKEQGDTAQADHVRAESDHTRAESDHAAVEMYVDSLGAFDISAYHATGSVLAKYADLTDAIGINGANIPDALRKGGMSVKFIQSSDNKYVQFRYMSSSTAVTDFTNVANWQKMKNNGLIQEMWLQGLTNGSNYFLRFYVGSVYKFVQIFNSTNTITDNLVASGTIYDDNIAILEENNSSGVYGFAKVDDKNSITQTSELFKVDNEIVWSANADSLGIPYYLENKTHNDNYIKEVYLEGLDNSKDYYFFINVGTVITVIIYELVNNSFVIVSSARLNSADGFNKFAPENNSGIKGVIYCNPTDYSRIVTDNCRTKIKNYEISNLEFTNIIANNYLYTPALNYKTRLFVDSSEYNGIIEELYLNGTAETKTYTIRTYKGSSGTHIQIFDGNTAVAQGTIRQRFVKLEAANNSGINGYAYLSDVNIGNIQTGSYVELNSIAFTSLYLSTNIAKFIGAPQPFIMEVGSVPAFGYIEELFLVGLAKDGLYRIRTYVGSSLTYLQIWDESNFLAFGVISGGGIIKIDEQNNSGISGYAKISNNINVSQLVTTNELYINNFLVSQLRFSPSIMLYLNLEGIGRNIVVDKNGVEDVLAGKYTSFAKAILDNYGNWNLHIAVEEGEYDLLSELEVYYGTPNFRTLTPGGRGIELGYNITIEGCPNAIIKADYGGSDENMQKLFSPLNISPENPGSVTLIGVNVKCSRVRYAMHDDKGSSVGMYTNIYDNCNFYIDNTDNDYWHASLCIGGGLGKSGNIIIRNSIFETVDPALPAYAGPAVSYHNSYSADAKSQLSITNNYIKGGRGFGFGWYGSSTKMTEIILAGNSVGRATIFEAERPLDFPDRNMELYEWNTIVRTS